MTDQELKQYCGAVTVPDREIMDAARRRQAELAKPCLLYTSPSPRD